CSMGLPSASVGRVSEFRGHPNGLNTPNGLARLLRMPHDQRVQGSRRGWTRWLRDTLGAETPDDPFVEGLRVGGATSSLNPLSCLQGSDQLSGDWSASGTLRGSSHSVAAASAIGRP